ncbi:uncharacterized protein [Hyperolius riggenbachi]|uniref:uncharacterized protein isoform X1 n=1 Tax=Hyperolius riggenbachi TaxID=752182 RepID=UPI0035A28FCD
MAVSSNKDYNNRRKFDGLGSPCGRTIPARVMDRPSKGRVIQLQRNEGSSYGPITSIRVSKGASSSGSFRQHNSSSLSEQTRRDKVQKTPRSVTEDLRLGRAESAIINSSPSERDIKSNGRPSKQTKTVKFRAEAQPGSIQNDNGQMGVARNRPFCQSDELSVQKVFLSRSEGSMCNRCVGPRLDLQQSICLSTNPLDSSCITEVETVQNDSDINSTRLAKTIMVPVVTKNAEKRSFTPPSGGITFRSRGTQMGTCSKSASKSVVSERDVLKSKGLSDRVIKTVLNSRKKVTRSIYSKYWKTFLDWKKRNKVKDNKLPTILEFLQDGIERGLALSTIKVQVAAISVFVDKKLALDPLVIRFMKSVERSRPIVKKSCPRWDLSLVLNVLMEEPFEPLEEISLRNLTIKTIFLVAITSAKRVSELEALSSDEQFCSIFEDRVILKTVTDFLPKVSSVSNRGQEIILPTFCNKAVHPKEKQWHKLDVRRCLLIYLKRVKQLRKTDRLFVNFTGNKVGEKMTKASIARWLKVCIEEAYKLRQLESPKEITAHSTRAMATSWAYRAGASASEICRAATWRSVNTFVRHYRLDLMTAGEQSFGRKVLQAVVPP